MTPVAGAGVGLVFALAYGLLFFKRPASPLKTLVKTAAVASIALESLFIGAPILLTAGLALCALGDAFLAGDPKRWLPPGLASFLAGHLVYVALFVATILRQGGPNADTLHLAGMAAAALIGAGMLVWLWRSLGGLRAAVAAYVVAIVSMVASSLMLPAPLGQAGLGALCFFASDGVLSAQLFKQRFTGLAGQWAVWGLYFIGQVLIAAPFLSAVQGRIAI